MRIGPFACEGSATTRPPWVISASPRATRRRAAARAGSISARHASSPDDDGPTDGPDAAATALAASDGQIVAPAARASRIRSTASSRAVSIGRTPDRRQASEQYRTRSQSRSHFLRHVIVRPQTAHGLVAAPAPGLGLGLGLIEGPTR